MSWMGKPPPPFVALFVDPWTVESTMKDDMPSFGSMTADVKLNWMMEPQILSDGPAYVAETVQSWQDLEARSFHVMLDIHRYQLSRRF